MIKPSSTSSHALVNFLQLQTQTTLQRLYTRPSSCLAILRLLEPLERQMIMNLLWLEQPVETSMITSWVTLEGRSAYEEALRTLAKLHILPDSKSSMLLRISFKTGLREALTRSGETQSFGVPASPEDTYPPLSPDLLDVYAMERWDTILHFMVTSGTEQVSARPSEGILYQLEHSGLMVNDQGRRKITSVGFQFLLQSPHAQLWDFMLSYLKMMAERDNMDMTEILGFFFMLSVTQLSQQYSSASLSVTQHIMLSDLRDFGLIYIPEGSVSTFQPTRLAATLTSHSPPLVMSAGEPSDSTQGFIVLETNYHLYAYTSNPLQIAVLNLFASFKVRFSNLIVGTLNRDSVKKALANGITADQIISYLVTHAHPQMKKNNPIIPVTVQDQIRLWELEKHRVKGQDGYLYKDFASMNDYEVVVQYARDLGVVLWESGPKRMFFADATGRVAIRSYIERRTAM